MKVKFYEGSNLKWSKNFLSEANADKFIAIMEEIKKPSITMESELYVNQRIPMYSVSEIATENLFVKNLEEGYKSGLNTDFLLECGIPTSICKMNEELVIQTSLDTAIRDYMVDLFSRIVCARDYAHLLHLNADSGGQHLMLEKIYEALDDMVDDCGEKYFMARNIKIPNPLEKNEIYAAGDLGDLLAEMSALCENICKDPNLDESIKSMVSGFGEDFQRCMGFWRQAQMDNPNKVNESIEKNIRVKPEVVKEIYLTIIEHLGKRYFTDEEFDYRNYLDTIKDFARELDDDFNEDNKELVKEYADAVLSYSKRKTKLSESVYIKRVKDGANKYFCNLNGSPAWGPKDLAIQFDDEVEAKKFLKKYDYLLSKNKITIVNESADIKKS